MTDTPATPLRIALVSLHTSPGDEPGSGEVGGMNVVVRHQAEALADLGHRVEIVTRRSSPTQPDSVEIVAGVCLRFLSAGPAQPVPKGEHDAFIEPFRAGLAELGPYDVFHAHHWFSGMAALPVARERGVPHVQSFHSIAAHAATPLSEGERPESAGRMEGEAFLARESDAVVAISEAEADTVRSRLGAAADRVVIVPPGVDGSVFRPASAATRAAAHDRPRYVVAAARVQPLKGLDLAIAAVAAVPEAVRPDLVIAGDASSEATGYVEELRGLADRLGIGDRVRFVGPQSRPDLAMLFRNAGLVLVPSHSETYGLVALEGSASGVPVVAAAAGGLREAVVDGETGVVVESRDPDVWAGVIATVLTDPALADQLAAAGRERAERLSWERSAEGLVETYRSVIARVEERRRSASA
ncbi:glycosyltransferase [Curtobacterium sp. MCBD17_003]|uniref:glycosyltransferase n=1 Tax=Curtobacterium sp. MCBD17_003 TaxID=2175667 RepID=UPI0021ACA8FC|nr:glycosyltransferase [Curtobacterium sp. MCBD17_003]WIE55733.1 glycosyltransferase [Curtobacterium sp. MCBD17_003]